MTTIYTVTVVGVSDAGEATYRWATTPGWIDAAGNVYEPRIIEAGNITRSLVRPGATSGRSTVGYGEIIINNADGELDALLNVAFDARECVIAQAGGTEIVRGTVGGVTFARSTITFRFRDAQAVIADKPIITATFAGDNILPAGLEGTANDIKGRTKCRAFGKVRVAGLPLCNTSKNIYLASASSLSSVDVIQDGGALITAGTAYATLADVEVTAPASTSYKAFIGSASEYAYVRLGTAAVRALTADVTEGATAADRTVAGIMTRIAIIGGASAANITGASDIDTLAGWTAGYWVQDGSTSTVGNALDALAASVHGYWIGDASGAIRFGLIRPPAGEPVLEIEDWMLLQNGTSIERTVGAKEGLPVWRVSVEYQRVWQTQTRDQLSGVAAAEQERLGKSYRTTTVREDATILARHPLADELTVTTCLDSETDAMALRDVLWTCYSVQRDTFTVAIASEMAEGVDLGDVVRLTIPRFGMSGGRDFVAIGRTDTLSRGITALTLWG